MCICANYMYMYLKMCPFVFHRANWAKHHVHWLLEKLMMIHCLEVFIRY